MSTPQPPVPISPFERIRHEDDAGEYWSARELAALLDYTEWRNFERVIKKAMIACQKSGQQVSDHFVDVNKVTEHGKHGKYTVKDYHLSRYACYLVIENADPEKEIVALGQTYFAIRTRHDEIEQERIELEQRLRERAKLVKIRRNVYGRAKFVFGIEASEDFETFVNHGYQGLYQETKQGINERKGLPSTENPANYMGVMETAANGFMEAMTDEMMKVAPETTKETAYEIHGRAGFVTREAMIQMGVPTPEHLPTPKLSIKEAQRRLKRIKQVEEEDRMGLWAQFLNEEDESE